MKRRARQDRGLTLIEVALAVAILAIMGTVTWGSIGRNFDAYEAVTSIDSKYHGVRVALNRMAHEISMAFVTQPMRDFGPEAMQKTIFKGKPEGDGFRLDFTSFAHEVMRQDAKESDQCEIGYFLDHDDDHRDRLNLIRRLDPRLDPDPEKGGRPDVLAEDVKKFKIRFYDIKDDDWTDEWDTDDPEFIGRLPTIVEISLMIEDADKRELTFMTKTRVRLPAALPKF